MGKWLGQQRSLSGVGEFVVLYGIVGIIRMERPSQPRMRDEERREYVMMPCIRMGGLKGIEMG